jgi:hypothetical protein
MTSHKELFVRYEPGTNDLVIGPETEHELVVHPWRFQAYGKDVCLVDKSKLIFPDAKGVEVRAERVLTQDGELVGVNLTFEVSYKLPNDK